MTYHFINLVSWQYFQHHCQNQKRYLDSISISLLALLFGVRLKKFSGVSFFHDNRDKLHDALFLVANSDQIFKYQLELPYWEDLDSIQFNDALRSKVKDFNKLVIGISSPKQDSLATQIQKEFPQKEIYCLGAAVYTNFSSYKVNNRFLWVYFLLSSPKRTLSKIKGTLIEFFSILFNPRKREQFKNFLSSLD